MLRSRILFVALAVALLGTFVNARPAGAQVVPVTTLTLVNSAGSPVEFYVTPHGGVPPVIDRIEPDESRIVTLPTGDGLYAEFVGQNGFDFQGAWFVPPPPGPTILDVGGITWTFVFSNGGFVGLDQ